MLRLQTPLPDRYRDASLDELDEMIATAKATLGERLFILGHHYQRDEVMKWADARGDSYRLSVLAQERPAADYIVFCGVHFMAESADILTDDHQSVILPDLNAGCSMADMADLEEVTEAWEALGEVIDTSRLVPITYMNSSAALKAFVGEHGGAVCTSTNAREILAWAFTQGDKVLFFPDQHLGRNTGIAMGYAHDDMRVWNPRLELGGLSEDDVRDATFLLWKGHCSVHQRFTPAHVAAFRAEHPDGIVIAHPECSHEVCSIADEVGSTDYIIKAVAKAPDGQHHRGGHRDPPGAAPRGRDPRQDGGQPRSAGVPVLHDVPHRCTPPGLDPREPGGGSGAQPDHGRPPHDRMGEGGAAADARHHPGQPRRGRAQPGHRHPPAARLRSPAPRARSGCWHDVSGMQSARRNNPLTGDRRSCLGAPDRRQSARCHRLRARIR
jgi:quinolinate synthase